MHTEHSDIDPAQQELSPDRFYSDEGGEGATPGGLDEILPPDTDTED